MSENKMKYCKACKTVSFIDGEECVCGRKFAKIFDLNDPVVLTVADGEKRPDIESALQKAEIPYSVEEDRAYSPSVGKISGAAAYLIPIGFLKKGLDAIGEKPDWYDKLDLPDDPEWEEMPKGKRTAIRVISFIAFLVLIWACVAGVDLIAGLFTKLF